MLSHGLKKRNMGTGTVETLARQFGETDREKASREKLEKEKRKVMRNDEI